MESSRLREVVAYGALMVVVVAAGSAAHGTPETREIVGVVRRVGSEPLTNLVVTQNDVDHIVPKDAESAFVDYIGATVRVAAVVRQEELQTVDGSFTVIRHYLVDPVVLGKE